MVDLGQRFLLLTSLGQLTQLRLWLPKVEFPIPPNIGLQLIKGEDGDILNLLHLDGDLYARLSQFLDFLKLTNLLEAPLLNFEADFESNFFYEDKSLEFSVMLSSNGQLILVYCSAPDLMSQFDNVLVKEWDKRTEFFNEEH